MIRRVNTVGVFNGEHLLPGPFVLDQRTYDVPETIEAWIRNMPDNCVAFSLRWQGGKRMVRRAERAARKRGKRILWM